MQKCTIKRKRKQFTAAASLAGMGQLLQQRDIFGPVRQRVQIRQKQVRYAPIAKLYQALVTLLAGAHGLVEANTLLRSDAALQAAFGCTGCAEQSVIQQTLDACTATNVGEMEAAVAEILRQHGQSYRHPYAQQWQLLDADLTGWPCGRKAEVATKGYFGQAKLRRGRQLLRVVASHYREVIVDQLVAGNVYLSVSLPQLMCAAEQALQLTAAQRQRTIVRLDAGGGSVADINWLLARGYHVHAKDYSAERVRQVVQSVSTWIADPIVPGRQVGWVTAPTDLYQQPVWRIAARCPRGHGQWGYGVIVSSLNPATVRTLVDVAGITAPPDVLTLLAYVYFYDQRGGGVETTFRKDKQGLGLTKRNKQRFAAQQMLMLLGSLAHNIILWTRRWLAALQPKLIHYGIQRWVRDVSHIAGCLIFDPQGQLLQIVLNRTTPLAQEVAAALAILLAPAHVRITLGEI
jgi:hypothetical protein